MASGYRIEQDRKFVLREGTRSWLCPPSGTETNIVSIMLYTDVDTVVKKKKPMTRNSARTLQLELLKENEN